MILEEILEQGLTEWKIPYNGTTLDRFRRYHTLLEETNKVMNLTAIEGEKDTAQLHFLDCAALLRTNVMEGKTVADIGTGAGFPGMVLKILCPETEFVLIDSLDKRIRFLQEVCEELQLSGIRCIHARAEELPAEYRERFDLVTSRAAARLAVLSELCVPYSPQGGRFVSMKGPGCQEKPFESLAANRRRSRSTRSPGRRSCTALLRWKRTGSPPGSIRGAGHRSKRAIFNIYKVRYGMFSLGTVCCFSVDAGRR